MRTARALLLVAVVLAGSFGFRPTGVARAADPPSILAVTSEHSLVELNGDTGATIRTIGEDPDAVDGDVIRGMAWQRDVLYGILDPATGSDILITISPRTGHYASAGVTFSKDVDYLISMDGQLYAMTAGSSDTGVVYAVDPAQGTATSQTGLPTNSYSRGMVVGPNNTLYLFYGSHIFYRWTPGTDAVHVTNSGGSALMLSEGIADADGVWYYFNGSSKPAKISLTDISDPGAGTEATLSDAPTGITGITTATPDLGGGPSPAEMGGIYLSAANSTAVSADPSNTRSLTVVGSGKLPGFMFSDGRARFPSVTMAATHPSTGDTGSIEFTLSATNGTAMRDPRDSTWLTDRYVELWMEVIETGDSANFLQTHDTSPQRFTLSSGDWKVSVPNNSSWTPFFTTPRSTDPQMVLRLIDTCGTPARKRTVDDDNRTWVLKGAYKCPNRSVTFTSPDHPGLSFASYLVAEFDVAEDYRNSYILDVRGNTEAAVISKQTIGSTVQGVYAHASPSKREAVIFLPRGDYYLLLKGDDQGDYDATLSYAGRYGGENLFGTRPANFRAQVAPDTGVKAVVAQWDAVEGAAGYFLRIMIGGRSHLVDTGEVTAARVQVDSSTQDAQVSALAWRKAGGVVEYTLDSNVVPVSWATRAAITATIPTPAPNEGSGMIRGYASSVLTSIGMEPYTTTDEAGETVTVDPAADRAPMIAMMICGFAAVIVAGGLYLMTFGNVMVAITGGVAIWSGMGPIFFELHPAVAYGPVALILLGGFTAAVKKFG